MEHKRIVPFLAILLAVSCLVLSVILITLNRRDNYLSNESVESLVKVMAEDNIIIDGSIIPTKLERGTVYVCASENYEESVASLLGNSEIDRMYVIPDGKIIILEDGKLVRFGENFFFEYQADGEQGEVPDLLDDAYFNTQLSEKLYAEISALAIEFLDRGSRGFDAEGEISVVTTVDRIAEKDGKYYAFCSRTIDGVEMAENTVLCTIESGVVTEAHGTWCFLTPGDLYSAQLSDILNILFNVKKEIGLAKEKTTEVRIVRIEKCYALYFYGEKDEFCLIPCKKIVTDSMGEYIYNAIDGALYTKK